MPIRLEVFPTGTAAVAEMVLDAAGQASLGLTRAGELTDATEVEFAGDLPDDVQVVSVYSGSVAMHALAGPREGSL